MKSAVYVQARSSSTRLPGKVFEGIPDAGSPSILEHVVRRMRAAEAGPVFVLIPAGDELERYLALKNIPFITGPMDDVRERYRAAARQHATEIIVRATADNPALDPLCARRSVEELISRRLDLFSFSGMPLGTGVEVFTAQALLSDTIDGPEYREHVSLHIKHVPDRFRIEHIPWRENLPAELPRVTVDTPEDLDVVRAVFRALGPDFSLPDLMELFESNPGLFQGNAHVVHKTFPAPGQKH